MSETSDFLDTRLIAWCNFTIAFVRLAAEPSPISLERREVVNAEIAEEVKRLFQTWQGNRGPKCKYGNADRKRLIEATIHRASQILGGEADRA